MIGCQWDFCQSTFRPVLPLRGEPLCRSIFHHCGRAFCRRLNFDMGPVDSVPFTFYSCFPTTTWDLIVSRFQTSGVLQMLAGDAPWTCDSDGHPLVNFSLAARSSIYFLFMNLWYHANRGTNFNSGVMSNFCVVALRLRMKHFATIFRAGSNFWNCRYLGFLLKVPSTLSTVDPVELSTIHSLRSPPDFNLRDMMNFLNQAGPEKHFERVGHTLVRWDFHNFLMQPGMMDSCIHPQASILALVESLSSPTYVLSTLRARTSLDRCT